MAAYTAQTPLPADIRLLNATASLIGGLGIAVLAAVALLWVARQPAFALRAIRVDGDLTHNSALTIRANAASKLAGNFFTLDLAAGRRAFESVPWVRQAIVHRVWPNRLLVNLEEQRAVALWERQPGASEDTASGGEGDTSDRLVNNYGEVFEANVADVEDEALPTLRGPDGSSPQMLALLGRLQPEFATLHGRIARLELSGRGSWRVELDNGVKVELGRGTDDELIARTRAFLLTLPELRARYQQHPLVSADLRHNDGYAVRLKGITTTPEAPAPGAKKDFKGPSKMTNTRPGSRETH